MHTHVRTSKHAQAHTRHQRRQDVHTRSISTRAKTRGSGCGDVASAGITLSVKSGVLEDFIVLVDAHDCACAHRRCCHSQHAAACMQSHHRTRRPPSPQLFPSQSRGLPQFEGWRAVCMRVEGFQHDLISGACISWTHLPVP
jgi:hypothetical protein